MPTAGRHPARWLHAVVEAEIGKPLRVVTLYGYDAGQPGAPERNVELFQDVFNAMAELGAAQWVIGGDWIEEAAAIWELVAAGHRGPLLPRGGAEVPGGTCAVGGRRIDFFVAAPVLCQAAEGWLQGWAGLADRRYLGRGQTRRVRLRPAEGRRGPVGTGEVGARARCWWRWLRALAAAPAGEDNAHSGVARLRARVGVCLPYLGGAWVERCDRIPGADQVDWAEEAEQGFRLAQAADAASRRAAWRDWVDGALRCRPGLLYRWVRGEVRLPQVATTVDGRWTLDPGAVVEVEAKKWSELWSPLGVECWAPRSPSGPLLRALDGAVLRGIARGLRPRVAAGADGWRALELKELPEVFWDRLADFLGACEAVGRWPEPLRVGIVALLPRPIVLLPLVYRIWAAARCGPGSRAPGRTEPRSPAAGRMRRHWRPSALGTRLATKMRRFAGSSWTAASATSGSRSSSSMPRLRRRFSRTSFWCWRSACILAGAMSVLALRLRGLSRGPAASWPGAAWPMLSSAPISARRCRRLGVARLVRRR